MHLTSLEPNIRTAHVSVTGRPALAFDLMEPSKAADSSLNCSLNWCYFNKNELTT
ncbi:MAG: CRISPR-associated endonuclease Cas1 [Deltaproteobacteria bacterium]|nr:CRISPR-associated endonuclease Cas1 [Deltaproteobacteria bacterium]